MIREYVETCDKCQLRSNVQYREKLHPTFSPTIHSRWFVDIVVMPKANGFRYLIMAREDVTDWVEGRALRDCKAKSWCRFIFEDIICRYGTISNIVADRGELASDEAKEYFKRRRINLRLTTAYNPEANAKVERGHGPVVQAIVKATGNNPAKWPEMLHYALWADRTTAGRVRKETPYRLMYGQNVVYPIESEVTSWAAIDWKYPMEREDLLAARIRQLERREDDLRIAKLRIWESREQNREYFNRTNRIRLKPLKPGDLVIVYDESLRKQWSRKFDNRWLGPYRIKEVFDNGSYALTELDGTELSVRMAGKRVKLFKRRVKEKDVYGPDIGNEDKGKEEDGEEEGSDEED